MTHVKCPGKTGTLGTTGLGIKAIMAIPALAFFLAGAPVDVLAVFVEPVKRAAQSHILVSALRYSRPDLLQDHPNCALAASSVENVPMSIHVSRI